MYREIRSWNYVQNCTYTYSSYSSSLRVLNFMLPAFRPYFTEVARTVPKVEQAWSGHYNLKDNYKTHHRHDVYRSTCGCVAKSACDFRKQQTASIFAQGFSWNKLYENLIIKPTRCTTFSNLFWNKTLHVLDSSSVHHQEFFTVHTAMVYVIQVYWQLASCQQTCMTYTTAFAVYRCKRSNGIRHTGLLTARSKPVWHIALLCVQWKTPDDGQRNCPKHVEHYSKINLRN